MLYLISVFSLFLYKVHFEGPREGLSSVLFQRMFGNDARSLAEAQEKSLQHQNKKSFIRNAHNLLEEGVTQFLPDFCKHFYIKVLIVRFSKMLNSLLYHSFLFIPLLFFLPSSPVFPLSHSQTFLFPPFFAPFSS